MPMKAANLFGDIPADIADELFESLVETSAFKLERIVSAGQTTPRDTWYDQERDEWVILLSGSAGLVVRGRRRASAYSAPVTTCSFAPITATVSSGRRTGPSGWRCTINRE